MYDIVGDIHGHAAPLRRLLEEMDYARHGQGYRHAERKVVFVGDFVDRGPAIEEVIAIARSTVDAGDGFAVMGNHEYNAIAFHTPIPGANDCWFRDHSAKNIRQHQATLDQLSPAKMSDAIRWFRTLPVALELNGIRVVHAAWRDSQIAILREAIESLGRFEAAFLAASETRHSPVNSAIEDVLKGPEMALPAGLSIVDKAGQSRNRFRIKWYEEPAGRSCRDYHFGSDEAPDVEISSDIEMKWHGYPIHSPPVFVGHYWLTGLPAPLAANVACTDYSVARGGKLAAYRWNGETLLSADQFCWVPSVDA